MPDENIQVTNEKAEKETCNCFCKSEGFRKFIVVALGSFTGVFCAISLFFALHKPPMMPPMYPMMQPPVQIQQFARPCKCECQKPHHKDFKKMDRPMKGIRPIEKNTEEIPPQ